MTTIEDVGPAGPAPSTTPVVLGRRRGGPDVVTLRRDRWWIQPFAVFAGLTAFVGYSTWAAFVNNDYFHSPYISPFYSPCVSSNCAYQQLPIIGTWWKISPAILIVAFPLGFRLTCYYYRRAYYRGFWQSPPACGVADAHVRYTGETRFPLIFQNLHRYFFLIGLVFNVILTIDAVVAFRLPGGGGVGLSVGTLVLVINAVLLWSYSLSCHAARHLCGGHVHSFSAHPIRYRIWKFLTPLNARHMQLAWVSLVFVALTDLYVRLVAGGVFSDPKIF